MYVVLEKSPGPMGSICCHMFRFNKAADKPLDKKDDSPATSNLKSVNMTSHMMTYEEEAVMSTSDKKRGRYICVCA